PGWTHPAAPTPVRPPPGSRTRKPVRARGFEPRVFPVSPVAVVRAPLASGAQCPDVGRVGRAALIAPAPALVRHDLTVCGGTPVRSTRARPRTASAPSVPLVLPCAPHRSALVASALL